MRLVQVLTVADSLIFIDTVVQHAVDQGHDVTVVTSPDARLAEFGRRLGVRTIGVEMPRRVSLLGDLGALEELRRHFTRLRPDVVHAGTPKGGLLGMLAAEACKVPVRVYQMRGLAYVTSSGMLRGVLETTERLSCGAATRVVCQSHSLHRQALGAGLVSEGRSEVILQGSNGVDAARFNPEAYAAEGQKLRERLGIAPNEVVFGFVGRLVRDKGVPELLAAFERLVRGGAAARLILAGDFEPRDPVPEQVRRDLETNHRVHLLGNVKEPAPVYAAADVVMLPSHREGFPNVPLEASAMRRPVVSTRVPGCIDAVQDGVTGTLVEVNDVEGLTGAMARYFADPDLRVRHGAAGRKRVEASFSRERIAEAVLALYQRELAGI